MINEDLTIEDLDPTIDSTIFGSQLESSGENIDIETIGGSDFPACFQERDTQIFKEHSALESLHSKLKEAENKTIGFQISDLMGSELAGLKKCLYLIILYMVLSIGLWTFQVTLMLNEGIAIMILIIGTILLLIPCIIYWLKYLNRILAQDEDSSTEKSQSDVLSGDDIQDIEMDDRDMAGNPDYFVVEVEQIPANADTNVDADTVIVADVNVDVNVNADANANTNANANAKANANANANADTDADADAEDNEIDNDNEIQDDYSIRRQQRFLQLRYQLQQRLMREQLRKPSEEEPGIEVEKVSEMPRIIVAGDLPPPPLDYEKDDNCCPFMIGLPKYLEGTQVEKDLVKSVVTSMAISGLPKGPLQGETNNLK